MKIQSNDVTRSVRRFWQILEFFESAKRPLSSSEIAEYLGAPKSSVGNLLRALVDLGVLIIDRRLNTYFPTVRFAELNRWIIDSWFPNNQILGLIQDLRDNLGETVCLSTPSDLLIEVLHAAQGMNPITSDMVTGQRVWMPFSAIGNAYLSTLPSATFGALVHRFANAAKGNARPFNSEELQKQVKQARQRGFAIAYDGITSQAGGVAIPLPSFVGPRPLVLSVGGSSERIRTLEQDLPRHLMSFSRSLRRGRIHH